MVSFPRENDAKVDYSGSWGHKAQNLMNGWSLHESRYTTFFTMDDYGGKICYCIEPGTPAANGNEFTQKDESFWDNYPSQYNKTIDADIIKLMVGRILQYGFTGDVELTWVPLLKELYLTECRKKSHAETVRKKLSRSALKLNLANIPASMLYPKSYTAETAERRTADAHGQKTERKRLYGDASADLITVKNTVKTHRQLKNQYFTMRLPRLLRKRLRWKKPMLLVSAGI